jgi:NAD+ synthase (glutamine-hydrolysing)
MDHGDFRSAYRHGFVRVAACTVPVADADPAHNAETILEQVRALHEDGVAVAVFPELGLSGYAIDDLLMQDVLLDQVDRAVVTIAETTKELLPLG